LLERLKEERVRRIIEPIILGEEFINKDSDDFRYAKELGLICVVNSLIEPANPIYAEVMIRKLSSETQDALKNPKYPYRLPRYLKDGRIDMDYLVRDFQPFWRENSGIWKGRCDYKEAATHLVMMAFMGKSIWRKASNKRPVTWTSTAARKAGWWFLTAAPRSGGATKST
jgi:hypothetical protein